jgi:prepilin-type processing-associated H-X9-DG protein
MSLVELLVVVGIIALVIGLTLPAVQRVRESAARTRCQNNVRQLALALHHFHGQYSALPSGHTAADGTPKSMRLSWHARVLPFIEQDALWSEILQAYATDPRPHTSDHPPHRAIQRTVVAKFVCPSDPRGGIGNPTDTKLHIALTSYLGVLGTDRLKLNGVLFMDSKVKLTDIRDGTTNTLLIGERPPPGNQLYGWWYGGIGQDGEGSIEVVLGTRELNHSTMGLGGCDYGPYSFQRGDLKDHCSRFHFWSFHSGGANFALADGSVRFLRYSVDSVMPALGTRAGGETVAVPE